MVGAGDAARGRSVFQTSSAGVHGDLGVRDKMSRKRTDRRSRLNRPLTTDFKDHLSNRARTKDSKGNEQ